MISYLALLVQFSPAAGRAGRCRQRSLCVESTRCVPATLGLPHTGVSVLSLSALLRLPAALVWSRPCVECGSSFRVLHKSSDSVAPACCAFPGLSGSGSQRLGCPLPGCGAPFPSVVSSPGSQRLVRPLPGHGALFHSAASGPGSQRLGCPLPGHGALFPSMASGPGSQKPTRPLSWCGAPSPSAAPARAAGRVSGSP